MNSCNSLSRDRTSGQTPWTSSLLSGFSTSPFSLSLCGCKSSSSFALTSLTFVVSTDVVVFVVDSALVDSSVVVVVVVVVATFCISFSACGADQKAADMPISEKYCPHSNLESHNNRKRTTF